MNPKDRHLDIPSEANRDKHINFEALENKDQDAADIPATGKLAADDAVDNRKEQTFHVVDNGTPYTVKLTSFKFNDDTRYYISVNDEAPVLYVWDEPLKQLRALNDSGDRLPTSLETFINEKLLS
jgi:hypothetical protein